MAALHGVGVLVTRPEQQAMPLCRLLQAQGATTLRLPAVEIRPRADAPELKARIGTLQASDLIVFASANAVRFGGALLEQRRDLVLAAIGPATARALAEAGYQVAIQPEDVFDSEALLADPRLTQLSGRRVLLVKGSNGRPLLEQEFARRGAQVVSVDVYDQMPSRPAAADLAAVRAQIEAGLLQVITATSLDIGTHLLDMAPRAGFEKLRWLVPGERVAAGLRRRGLQSPLLTATSAEDQDLLSELLRWRSEESDA